MRTGRQRAAHDPPHRCLAAGSLIPSPASPPLIRRQQRELARRVVAADDAGFDIDKLRLVGGLDCSFFPENGGDDGGGGSSSSSAGAGESGGDSKKGERMVAALAALSFPALEAVHVEAVEARAPAPYAPGLLGFREVPAYLELLRRAAAAGVEPQLLLVDGCGRLHDRRCGSASMLGVLSGLPAVGVAKSLLRVEGLPGEKEVRAAALAVAAEAARAAAAAAAGAAGGGEEGGARRRDWLPLVAADGEVLGAAVCVGAGAGGGSGAGGSGGGTAPRRPIYVSVGHRVCLETAVAVARRCCRHRAPEPIRQADLASRARVRALLAEERRRARGGDGGGGGGGGSRGNAAG